VLVVLRNDVALFLTVIVTIGKGEFGKIEGVPHPKEVGPVLRRYCPTVPAVDGRVKSTFPDSVVGAVTLT
jgi:hypothetical protein